MMYVNVNDEVSVTLTKKGAEIWNNTKGDMKKEGYVVETELWEIMKIFGPHFYFGQTAFFEENTIKLGVIYES